MKFFYNPVSTYSQKTMIAFLEKNVTYTPEIVDFNSESALKSHRKIWPIGKVPVLQLDDGHIIPESSIIIEWLDAEYDSGTRLIPTDKELARKTRFQDRCIDLYLNNPVVSLFFETRKPKNERNETLIKEWEHRVNTFYTVLDKQLEKSKYLVGDSFTMADCAATPALFIAQRVLPYSKHKNVSAYAKRVLERPSWMKVLKEAGPHLEKLTA